MSEVLLLLIKERTGALAEQTEKGPQETWEYKNISSAETFFSDNALLKKKIDRCFIWLI